MTNPTVEFRTNGIYLVHRTTNRRVADPILVTAFATRQPGTPQEQAFTQVQFQDRRGLWKKDIVPSSMLIHGGEFVTFLSSRGYQWPSARKLRSQIVDALAGIKPERDITVTDVPGWHGTSFVLPDESYSAAGPDREKLQINYNSSVRMGAFAREGTEKAWIKHIGRKFVHSSRARLAVAAAFAAPNLRPLKVGTFGLNFSGQTSGGKTLLVRLAASVVGLNSREGPATWDGTPAAFEQRALGHRDSIIPLDDISHLEGDPSALVKLVTFRPASNKPKEKAGQYVRANNLVDGEWRVLPLSTSEDPLWAQLHTNSRKSPPVRGEEVRMINIRACVSSMGDVFDGKHSDSQIGRTVEQRARFVEKLEKHAIEYQGEPYRIYLSRRVRDKQADERLKKYVNEFIGACPLPKQLRWLARIQKLFAVTYGSAALAIDYGVLPWRKGATLRDIKACMNDAMEQLTAHLTPESEATVRDIPSETPLLSQFKRRFDEASLLKIRPGSRRAGSSFRKKLQNAPGIVRSTRPGRSQCLLFSKTLKTWFPEASARKRLSKLLRERGIIIPGKRADTTTRQVSISELGGKIACYAISRKRLRAFA